MKKYLSLLMIGALTIGLVACGSSKKATEETTGFEEATGPVVEEVKIDNPAQYAELGKYKGLTIEGTKVEVTEEQIDDELEDIRYQYSDYQKIDRKTVKDGDIVSLDFECTTADGKTVEDYTQSEFDVTIGSEEMVYGDDLDVESALIGKNVGDKVKVTGTFYDDDTFGDVAGQKVTFVVTINYIEEEVLPELNDKFVKENLDYDTLKEYREAVRQELQEQAEMDVDGENESALWELVVANSKQLKEFPADMVAKEKENTIAYEREWADYFGMDIGETEEDIEDYFKENYDKTVEEYAKDSLFRQCLLQLIVEKEGIEPTDDEINQVAEQEMEAGGYNSLDEVYADTSKEEIRDQIIQEKVMKILTDNATIKEK